MKEYPKDGKAEQAIRDRIDTAVEAPVQDDQRDINACVMASGMDLPGMGTEDGIAAAGRDRLKRS